jgi:hypothetical protein
MLNDPRDPGTYRIAIAALGLALAVLLAGICWIAAVHVDQNKVTMDKLTLFEDKRDPVHREIVTVNEHKGPELEMGHIPVRPGWTRGGVGLRGAPPANCSQALAPVRACARESIRQRDASLRASGTDRQGHGGAPVQIRMQEHAQVQKQP